MRKNAVIDASQLLCSHVSKYAWSNFHLEAYLGLLDFRHRVGPSK